MKKSRAMRAALVGAFAILMLPAGRASADQTSDLKSEIEAQRALIEAQRARLDALEKKLDAAVTAQQATETKQAAQAAEAKQAADAREAAAKEAAENGFKMTLGVPVDGMGQTYGLGAQGSSATSPMRMPTARA
jgi:septal ring factor EnvC (AmiA/AmiB activator)